MIFRMYARGYYRRLMYARKHAAEKSEEAEEEEEEEEEKRRSENEVVSIDSPEPHRLGPVTQEKLQNEPREYTPQEKKDYIKRVLAGYAQKEQL